MISLIGALFSAKAISLQSVKVNSSEEIKLEIGIRDFEVADCKAWGRSEIYKDGDSLQVKAELHLATSFFEESGILKAGVLGKGLSSSLSQFQRNSAAGRRASSSESRLSPGPLSLKARASFTNYNFLELLSVSTKIDSLTINALYEDPSDFLEIKILTDKLDRAISIPFPKAIFVREKSDYYTLDLPRELSNHLDSFKGSSPQQNSAAQSLLQNMNLEITQLDEKNSLECQKEIFSDYPKND